MTNLLLSFAIIIFGIIYGAVFWWTKQQPHFNWLGTIIRFASFTLFCFYLLNFYPHSFILLALPLFLVTFWITVFKLES